MKRMMQIVMIHLLLSNMVIASESKISSIEVTLEDGNFSARIRKQPSCLQRLLGMSGTEYEIQNNTLEYKIKVSDRVDLEPDHHMRVDILAQRILRNKTFTFNIADTLVTKVTKETT